jgi:hypothetical protein
MSLEAVVGERCRCVDLLASGAPANPRRDRARWTELLPFPLIIVFLRDTGAPLPRGLVAQGRPRAQARRRVSLGRSNALSNNVLTAASTRRIDGPLLHL